MELAFSIANGLALSGWLVLILGPRRWPWLFAWPARVVPVLLAVGYTVLVLVWLARADGGYGSLADVGRLFESEPVRLAGWVHYLAFDLFVGAWIARRADASGIGRLIQAPVLLATFLFGPLGLLLHFAVAQGWRALGRRQHGMAT